MQKSMQNSQDMKRKMLNFERRTSLLISEFIFGGKINEADSNSSSNRKIADIYFLFGLELEFYINQQPQDAELDTDSIIVKKIYTDFLAIAAKNNVKISEIEAEEGFNQFEIHIIPTDAVENVCQFVKDVQEYSLSKPIILQAKPSKNQPSSAMHMHISMYNGNDENMFVNAINANHGSSHDYDEKYSPIFYNCIAGLLKTMPQYMHIFAPTESCYDRFSVPKKSDIPIHNPTNYSWGINNRTCAIRVPRAILHDPANTRIEHRICSPMANPYTAFASIINGIFTGITQKLTPPQPIFGNAFSHDYDDIKKLPFNLSMALTTKKDVEI